VSRSELCARLDDDYRVALVAAPAGHGKTATLASWAAGHHDRLAWLSCDASDAEPTRFMSCLLSAVSARWPGVVDDAFVLLERGATDTYDSAISLANELANLSVPGVIVVDDLHLAAPAPDMLTAFIETLPAGFRLVAGTRSDPPLPLARLRLRGGLVGAAQRRSALFRHRGGGLLRAAGRARRATRSGPASGAHRRLAAGAQLAAIALQRGCRVTTCWRRSRKPTTPWATSWSARFGQASI